MKQESPKLESGRKGPLISYTSCEGRFEECQDKIRSIRERVRK